MIYKAIFLFSVIVASGAPAQAQPPSPAPAVKAAMQKVAWLIGEWEGDGWRVTQSGAVETFTVSEVVEAKLDGQVLVIEGRGWSHTQDGVRVDGHHAIGVFSYSAHEERYHFDAFVSEGYQTRATPEIGENTYSWSHSVGPNAEMQYTAQLTSDGAWFEIGSYCRADDCQKTFEMRLTRIE